MVDYRDITYDETKDPAARRFGFSEDFKEISRDPVRTPFQWDDTKNAGKAHSLVPLASGNYFSQDFRLRKLLGFQSIQTMKI